MKLKTCFVLLSAFVLLAWAGCNNLIYPVSEYTDDPVLVEYAAEVVKLVNMERAKVGLSALSSANAKLNKAANIRVKETVVSFSHTRPNGKSCFTALSEVGLTTYKLAGENIAAGQQTPSAVMAAWMNSPGHKENILRSQYTSIGVSVCKPKNSYYGIYWVQMFIGD